MRTLTRIAGAVLVTTIAFGASAPSARAAATPEQKCQKARKDAAAKYAQCHEKAVGQLLATNNLAKLQPALSKCRVAYTSTWLKLQKKALGTGSTCDAPRFVATGQGTVVDNLTGLEWEMKNDIDATAHDKDHTHSWRQAYLCFLTGFSSCPGLNEADSINLTCFADPGTCNWRLPTVAELQTILSEPFPCTTSPCIDAVFGPTAAHDYWSATTLANYAWSVSFVDGTVSYGVKGAVGNSVRGVRGGF